MTASDLVAAVILKATGETSVSVSGDSDWLKVLGIANIYIDNWANEPDVDWHSLYAPEHSIGAVTATDSFTLDLSVIRKLSATGDDYIRIDHSDGIHSTTYQLVDAETLKQYYTGNKKSSTGNYCAQIGPTLVFNHRFVSTDPQYGGTIKVPVYLYPSHLVEDDDVVPVDNPNWLVFVTAAEWVRNDITKQSLYPLIVNETNQLMQRMIDDNDSTQVENVIKSPVGRGREW